MKKVRKGKKILVTLIMIIVVIIAATIITQIVKHNKKDSTADNQQEDQIVSLPETTTASGMDAQNIYMEYLKDQDRTMITMRITNNTSKKITDEEFNAILIGSNENVLGQMRTGTNTDLNIGEQCEISVIYKGNMTDTQRIKLEPIQQ
mgnify:FL=1